MAAALTARGHKVEVVCLSDHLEHDDSAYQFRVHRIRRGLFWPWRVLLTTFAIWRVARRHDLAFVNGLGTESAVGALLAGRPSVHKIVGDYAWERAVGRGWFRGTMDDYQTSAKNPVLRLLDLARTFPVRLASQVIVPSRYLSGIVEGWGIPPRTIQLVYNAVAASTQSRDLSATLPEWSGRTLITVCRLVRWKGVEALIRLLPELPDTRLVIAGDGHLRGELEALA
ncbi:MAG: glycosyltransferase, partial [Verrucomicrobiota bacterium]|nr:glycosyltransferase [Verrucomicrobiota bacterium]